LIGTREGDITTQLRKEEGMKMVKWSTLILGIVLVVIQFIRPERNAARGPSANAMGNHFPVPASVQSVFERSCYDCHSDNTKYPWYAEVMPVGWWLAKHIRDGKRGLDFDQFGSYRAFRQYRRFNDIIEQVNKDEMPLPSYLLIHRYARLTAAEKSDLEQWCTAMRDSMKVRYPVDSLERRPGGQRPRRD
jgi:hypothetical protein